MTRLTLKSIKRSRPEDPEDRPFLFVTADFELHDEDAVRRGYQRFPGWNGFGIMGEDHGKSFRERMLRDWDDEAAEAFLEAVRKA